MPNSHSNLPPGVSTNMIPGNRPEDEAEENFWDTFEQRCDEKKIAIPANIWDENWFVNAVELANEMGLEEGFATGVAEERLSTE
jgi:hypothetical protein